MTGARHPAMPAVAMVGVLNAARLHDPTRPPAVKYAGNDSTGSSHDKNHTPEQLGACHRHVALRFSEGASAVVQGDSCRLRNRLAVRPSPNVAHLMPKDGHRQVGYLGSADRAFVRLGLVHQHPTRQAYRQWRRLAEAAEGDEASGKWSHWLQSRASAPLKKPIGNEAPAARPDEPACPRAGPGTRPGAAGCLRSTSGTSPRPRSPAAPSAPWTA